jgi:hypothetical protein
MHQQSPKHTEVWSSPASPPLFTISISWLRRHATKGCGWTRRQIEALGLPYPQSAGWPQRIAGTQITQAQRAAFEAASKAKPGASTAPRRAIEPAGPDDSAQLGAYVRAFAALARCDSRTTAFMHWIADSVERLSAGAVSRAERRTLVEEAERSVRALLAAASAGEPRGAQ